ncbi:AAEL013379-PA [Aedes aegypti]|uniref:AAEL013379-PA n=1 Tax=Aedes aegypti TaxID=7159 RepID=Q16JC4_AEDAE|nr:AAEL013379-PA [Aedes aegypti]
MQVSLNINIDGLPIYKNSANHFWPIIANIHESPHIPPMILGIYYGPSKPKDANEFLSPVVTELSALLDSGVPINGHRISLGIRAFICDTLARGFIKCDKNFNGKHGCIKCTTKGKYSYDARTMVFPKVNAEL